MAHHYKPIVWYYINIAVFLLVDLIFAHCKQTEGVLFCFAIVVPILYNFYTVIYEIKAPKTSEGLQKCILFFKLLCVVLNSIARNARK